MPNGYTPYRTGTLLIPSGPSNHLYVILTDANAAEEHLLASITSVPEVGFYDPTCILTIGDHPFLKHESYVFYRKADVQRATRIARLVNKNFYIPREDMAEEITQRILDGILASDFTPNFCKNFTK